MTKANIQLTIVGSDPEDVKASLVSLSAAFGATQAGTNTDDMSAEDLITLLETKLPDSEVILQPKAKANGAEPATESKKRGRPPKAATTETADPFGDKTEEAAPSADPAAQRKQAVDMLMSAYGDTKKRDTVLALLKKYSVKKFAEVGDDKAGELLADAQKIG